MSRKLLFVFVFALLLAILVVTFGIALAENGAFQPGNPLYEYQRLAEDQRLKLISNDTDKALYLLELALRRADDVLILAGSDLEGVALNELNLVVDKLVTALRLTPASEIPRLQGNLVELVIQIDAIQSITQGSNPLLAGLLGKVAVFRALVTPEQLASAREAAQLKQFANQPPGKPGEDSTSPLTSLQMVDPRAISFPPGSPGAEHDFFPLTGQHADLECEACHRDGRYAGTPRTCVACHNMDTPANHFVGPCSSCHNTNAWKPSRFDHAVARATDCVSCHTRDKPRNHFSGQCSSCHNTSAWKPARFNHATARATDCASCHTKDKPRNHFSGQCSLCHNTSAWKPASFNHRAMNATDCISCHRNRKPRNHFDGQCSNCHTTNAWRPATFDHRNAGSDCISCHINRRPRNHFDGQCSNCHTTNAWKPATFDHRNAGNDCISCHINRRPRNHFDGQCSNCHTTNAWKPATFNHQNAGNDCQSCHAGDRPNNHPSGQCSSCHSTNAWKPATFSHQNATDCQSCHSSDRPNNHFSGQCSNCHSTNAWKPANFSHQNVGNDCQSCHNRPSGHWGGQCSQCHATDSWGNLRTGWHTFPMRHGGANGNCSRCHSGTNTSVNCYTCHDRQKMEDKHAEKDIFDIANRCLQCHPDGKED